MPRARTPRLLSNAKTLRLQQTDAELRLWLHLRDRRLCGRKFRRRILAARSAQGPHP